MKENNSQDPYIFTSKRFPSPEKLSKPGPYRIKFFYEEKEKEINGCQEYYHVGERLKNFNRASPIPLHIRDYITKIRHFS
jgi:hypothetical protein